MSNVLFRSVSRQLIKTHCISRSTGYYVVIPEVPDDTEETNAVLRTGGYPEFNSVNIQDCHRGLGKLLIEVETGVSRLEGKLIQKSEQNTFESVILPLENVFSNLNTAANLVKVKSYTQHDRLASDTLSQLYLRIVKALVAKFENATIYRAVKELKADEQHLSEYERRVVDKFLIEGKQYGAELTGKDKDKIVHISQRIAQHCGIFQGKVRESIRRYKYMEYDPDKMLDVPKDVLYASSVDKANPASGPWCVTLGSTSYNYFMQFSTDRKARCSLWLGRQTVASHVLDNQLYTNENITEIIAARDAQARLLGYKNYPHMKLEDTMIGSVDNVQNMLATLTLKAKPAQEKELTELTEFAISNGASYKLEIWDIPFWQRKHMTTFFERDPQFVRHYLPFDSVFSNLLKFAEELFNITFTKGDAEIWHPDVSFYEVSDTQSGKLLGAFYLDPYVRPGKVGSEMIEGRKRSYYSASVPYVTLLFDFEPPSSKYPTTLSLQDTRFLLRQFGLCMQQLLSEAPHFDISAVNDIEIDANTVLGHFFENWIFEPTFLSRIGRHWSTGESIPTPLIEGIQQLGTHMTGHHLCHQLYLADFDLTLHTDMKSGWGDVIKELWPKYMPFHLDRKNCHPCSFTDIFSGRYGAAYYSHIWNKIVAADIYQAFQEVGPAQTTEVNKLGHRLRDTYIKHGNGIKSSELFRRFLGRDPSVYSLLHQLGLSKSNSPKKRN